MTRFPLPLAIVLGLSACASGNDLDEKFEPIGDFKLGHNIVVANDPQTIVISRKATPEELQTAVEQAIEERFRRYEGDKLYHLGVTVDGYTLAPPGIPLVASPKSVLIIRVTVWDDAAGKKLNEEPHQIVIVEAVSAKTLFGSGLTQTKEEQIASLARSAAKQIEIWLQRQRRVEGWFGGGTASPDEDAGNALDAAAGTVDG